jgi:hypothetical protein
MALVRCPSCGRVADGIMCFACGYEWSGSEPPSPASASPPPAPENEIDLDVDVNVDMDLASDEGPPATLPVAHQPVLADFPGPLPSSAPPSIAAAGTPAFGLEPPRGLPFSGAPAPTPPIATAAPSSLGSSPPSFGGTPLSAPAMTSPPTPTPRPSLAPPSLGALAFGAGDLPLSAPPPPPWSAPPTPRTTTSPPLSMPPASAPPAAINPFAPGASLPRMEALAPPTSFSSPESSLPSLSSLSSLSALPARLSQPPRETTLEAFAPLGAPPPASLTAPPSSWEANNPTRNLSASEVQEAMAAAMAVDVEAAVAAPTASPPLSIVDEVGELFTFSLEPGATLEPGKAPFAPPSPPAPRTADAFDDVDLSVDDGLLAAPPPPRPSSSPPTLASSLPPPLPPTSDQSALPAPPSVSPTPPAFEGAGRSVSSLAASLPPLGALPSFAGLLDPPAPSVTMPPARELSPFAIDDELGSPTAPEPPPAVAARDVEVDVNFGGDLGGDEDEGDDLPTLDADADALVDLSAELEPDAPSSSLDDDPIAPTTSSLSKPPEHSLSSRVGTLAEALEEQERFADAALLYEVQAVLAAQGR